MNTIQQDLKSNNHRSGRFWATSVTSFRERLLDFRSCWIVFIHVVWVRQFVLVVSSNSNEAVKIFLASVSSGIRTIAEQGEMSWLDNNWKVWLLGCPSHLIISHIVVQFDSSWQLLSTQSCIGRWVEYKYYTAGLNNFFININAAQQHMHLTKNRHSCLCKS